MPASRPEHGGAGAAEGSRAPYARFDDLRSAESVELRSPGPAPTVLVADRPEEVVPVLRAVEEAAASGRWSAGFVAYEAAGGLDPTLLTRTPAPSEPFGELPRAWFCLFDGPRSVEGLEPGAETEGSYTVAP